MMTLNFKKVYEELENQEFEEDKQEEAMEELNIEEN